jgi:hypothetical protein
LWSNSATTATTLVTEGGTYAVTITSSNGCANTTSSVVTVNSLPTAVITPDGPTTFCQGGSVTLTASGGTGYLWSTAATTATIAASTSGTYTVTVTNANDCTNSTSSVVTVNSLPTAVITADGPTTFCQGGSVTLTASGGNGYLWSNLATGASISVTTEGTYDVTVTNAGGCTNSAGTTVTVHALPTAVITPDGPTTFCQGGSVMLTASGGVSYLWSTSATTASVVAVSGGTYLVTVTNINGCSKTTSKMVIVKPLPEVVITPDGPTTFCDGGSVTLTATGGSGYLWSSGATTSAITVAAAGIYTVTVTNVFGCTGMGTETVTVNPLLPVSVVITPSANPVLPGDQVAFSASVINGGTMPSFQWMLNGAPVAGASGETFSYYPSNNNEVACMVTSNAPCASGSPATSNLVVMSVAGVPVNTTVTGTISNGQNECFGAQQTVTVAGGATAFTVFNGGSATMVAGQNVVYLPGTSVRPGGYMHGYITTGNEFCIVPAHPESTAGITGDGEHGREGPLFKIYPNPAPGNVTVEEVNGKQAGKFSVEIYNMRGELVYKNKTDCEKTHECQIRDFPVGCYFLKVVAGNRIESWKLVKSGE